MQQLKVKTKKSLDKTLKVMKFSSFILLIGMLIPNLIIGQESCNLFNQNNGMKVVSFNKYMPGAKVDNGFYRMNRQGKDICVRLSDQNNRNRQHYMIENCFESNEFEKLNSRLTAIVRESGTLQFEDPEEKQGEFTFRKDPKFVKFLRDSDIALDNDLYYFKLFLGDIDKEYISDIIQLGFEPTITELGRLVWHDASADYIQKMSIQFPDFELEEISMMSANGISIEYVRGLKKAGIEEMDAYSIKKANNLKLTPRKIRAQRRKGNDSNDLREFIRVCKKS